MRDCILIIPICQASSVRFWWKTFLGNNLVFKFCTNVLCRFVDGHNHWPWTMWKICKAMKLISGNKFTCKCWLCIVLKVVISFVVGVMSKLFGKICKSWRCDVFCNGALFGGTKCNLMERMYKCDNVVNYSCCVKRTLVLRVSMKDL